jgi:hypothetical protein
VLEEATAELTALNAALRHLHRRPGAAEGRGVCGADRPGGP